MTTTHPINVRSIVFNTLITKLQPVSPLKNRLLGLPDLPSSVQSHTIAHGLPHKRLHHFPAMAAGVVTQKRLSRFRRMPYFQVILRKPNHES